METIFRDMKSIGADERRVYESAVGHALDNDQCVVIRVIERGNGSEEGVRHSPEEWSEEKNSRRCDLIDRQIEGDLSPEERIELEDLQRQAMAYRDRVAPLPIEGTRRLHQELLEKKRCSEAKE